MESRSEASEASGSRYPSRVSRRLVEALNVSVVGGEEAGGGGEKVALALPLSSAASKPGKLARRGVVDPGIGSSSDVDRGGEVGFADPAGRPSRMPRPTGATGALDESPAGPCTTPAFCPCIPAPDPLKVALDEDAKPPALGCIASAVAERDRARARSRLSWTEAREARNRSKEALDDEVEVEGCGAC